MAKKKRPKVKKNGLYKTTIVIWSEKNPGKLELSELAREAEVGEAYCAKSSPKYINDPRGDSDWDGTEFFDIHLDADEN